MALAAGMWRCFSVIKLIAGIAGDCEKLADIGFELHELLSPEDVGYEDEQALASALWSFQLTSMAGELLDGMCYTHFFPHVFAALIGHDVSGCQRALAFCKAAWTALLELESWCLEKGDKWVQLFLHDWLWPDQTWCREILVGVSETDFAGLPKPAELEVRSLFRGWGSTVVIENEMNVLRTAERQHRASKLGRVARWHRAKCSEDMAHGDRKPVDPEPNCSSGARSLPDNVFLAQNRKLSLGEDAEKQFLAGPGPWSQPKPDALPLSWMATNAMVILGADVAKLKQCWRSLLALPGCLLRRNGQPYAGVVIKTTMWGALILRGRCLKLSQDVYCWDFSSLSEPLYEHAIITDYREWRSAALKPLAPACQASRIKELGVEDHPPLPHGRVALAERAAVAPVLEASANEAFPNMTMAHLQLLKDAMGVSGNKNVTEYVARRRLVEAALPGRSCEEYDAIMAKSKCKAPERFSTVLTTASVDNVDGIIDQDLFKALKEKVRKGSTEKLQRDIIDSANRSNSTKSAADPCAAAASSSKAIPKRAASRGARSRKEPAKPRALVLPPGNTWTKEQIDPFIPKVTGCCISRDGTLHMRWKVKYPNAVPPFSTSLVWNDAVSERDSVLFCLQWVWREHVRNNPEEVCPWIFPDSLYT